MKGNGQSSCAAHLPPRQPRQKGERYRYQFIAHPPCFAWCRGENFERHQYRSSPVPGTRKRRASPRNVIRHPAMLTTLRAKWMCPDEPELLTPAEQQALRIRHVLKFDRDDYPWRTQQRNWKRQRRWRWLP